MSGIPSFNNVDYEIRGAVAFIVLNRPESLNALSEEMALELAAALGHAAHAARAVLLTGAGRGFCAGASLSPDRVTPSQDGYDAGLPLEQAFNPLIRTLRDTPVPIVAAVNGAAAGFGASIVLACDFVIAAESAYLLQAFRHIGLVPDGGASHALVRTVGRLRATELMMLGERVTAAQAQQWGLINRVVPDADLPGAAADIAEALAAGPTRALAGIKRIAWAAANESLEEMLLLERRAQKEAGDTLDHREGISAFLEKRRPRFTGL